MVWFDLKFHKFQLMFSRSEQKNDVVARKQREEEQLEREINTSRSYPQCPVYDQGLTPNISCSTFVNQSPSKYMNLLGEKSRCKP